MEKYIVVFKYYAFDDFLCDTFADVSSFSLISGLLHYVASFNPMQPHFMVLVYLLVAIGLSVCRSLKKLKNQFNRVQWIIGSKSRGKVFFSKN